MQKKSSDKEHRLPSLSLVFGYIAVKELQRLEDRIRVLDRLGYGSAEIAKICGTTAASVRAIRSMANRKPASKLKGTKK